MFNSTDDLSGSAQGLIITLSGDDTTISSRDGTLALNDGSEDVLTMQRGAGRHIDVKNQIDIMNGSDVFTLSVEAGGTGHLDTSNNNIQIDATLNLEETTMSATKYLNLGHAYVTAPITQTGYLILKDSTGTQYKVMVGL
jgi:hypothetical protein